jgi:hypothetical protein
MCDSHAMLALKSTCWLTPVHPGDGPPEQLEHQQLEAKHEGEKITKPLFLT